MTMEKHPDDKKPVVEYAAKITLPDNEVIEKTVSTVGNFPSSTDFDLSTWEGLLRDFGLLEKSSKLAGSSMGNCLSNTWTLRLKKTGNGVAAIPQGKRTGQAGNRRGNHCSECFP